MALKENPHMHFLRLMAVVFIMCKTSRKVVDSIYPANRALRARGNQKEGC